MKPIMVLPWLFSVLLLNQKLDAQCDLLFGIDSDHKRHGNIDFAVVEFVNNDSKRSCVDFGWVVYSGETSFCVLNTRCVLRVFPRRLTGTNSAFEFSARGLSEYRPENINSDNLEFPELRDDPRRFPMTSPSFAHLVDAFLNNGSVKDLDLLAIQSEQEAFLLTMPLDVGLEKKNQAAIVLFNYVYFNAFRLVTDLSYSLCDLANEFRALEKVGRRLRIDGRILDSISSARSSIDGLLVEVKSRERFAQNNHLAMAEKDFFLDLLRITNIPSFHRDDGLFDKNVLKLIERLREDGTTFELAQKLRDSKTAGRCVTLRDSVTGMPSILYLEYPLRTLAR